MLKLLTKPAEGASHASALLKGANAEAAETQCLLQIRQSAHCRSAYESHKNRESTDCVTGPRLESQVYVRGQTGREANTMSVCVLDKSSAPVSPHSPSSLSRSRKDGLSFVADSTRFHFQANQLSFFLSNSAFTPLS